MSEIKVKVEDSEKCLTNKYLIYETYEVDGEDPIIKDCIEKTVKEFSGEPEKVRVIISLLEY